MTVTVGRRVGWAIATTIGWALGFVLANLISAAIARPLGAILGGLLFVAFYGAVVGLIVAIAQWLAMPRGAVRWHRVVLATVAGMAIGLVATSIVGELLGNAVDPLVNVIVGEGLIEDTSGAVLGIAVAIAQWLALREVLPRARWWIAATAIGAGLAYGTGSALLEVFELPLLKTNLVLTFGATLGLFVGIAQAFVLVSVRAVRAVRAATA